MHYISERLRVQDGRYRAILRYRDAEGNIRQKTKTLKSDSKREAVKELQEWRMQQEEHFIEEQTEVRRKDAVPTLKEAVESHINTCSNLQTIEPVTVSGYRGSLKLIAPFIGHIKVDELTKSDIEKAETALLQSGKAGSTVAKVHVLVKGVLERLVEADVIAKNPMRTLRAPKRIALKKGINYLDKATRDRLLESLSHMSLDRIQMATYIALLTGMRRGEICGLRWRDVDLKGATIKVMQAVAMTGGASYVKRPKTDTTRIIAIPQRLVDKLEEWRELGHTKEYVIDGKADTTYTSPDVITKEWHILANMLGLEGTEGRICSFHDLRHTWATAAVSAGIDIKTVSSNLGHANAAMTLNIYASADPEAKKRAAEKMNEVI